MPTQLYPLTAFEEYMLIDETVDHPMTFFLGARLVGPVNVADLQAAFADVVSRHPILWSTVDRSRRCPCWKIDPQRLPKLDVKLNQPTGQCQLPTYIDVETEPGIRARLNFCGDASELWLQFHHSCSDGIGGLNFMKQLFAAYRARLVDGSDGAHEPPAAFPTERCAFDRLSRPAKLSRLVRDLARLGSFLRKNSLELDRGGDNHADSRPTPLPSFLETRLPFRKAMLERLKESQPIAPTVNDVLLRDIYLALGDWVRAHRATSPSGWIRILAPTNMRSPQAKEIACHNDVGMVFLDRHLQELADPADLLHGTSREMRHVKRDNMGHAFLRVIHFCRKLPRRLTTVRNLRRAFATVIVSNLGCLGRRGTTQPLDSCGLTVDQFVFLVPIRVGTPVSFGVLTHATELSIGMQYDDAVIDRASAEQLLALVRARLAASLENSSRPDTPDQRQRAA